MNPKRHGGEEGHRGTSQLTSKAAVTTGGGSGTRSGLLVGVGVAAFVDETVFHQLLHWHHFYDRSTPDAALVSDGIFHAVGWFALVAGLFWFAALRHRADLHLARWVGGLLIGAGGFQLYDGTVQHKVLGLHQIRYHVDLLTYDLTWNLVAVLLVLGGTVVTMRAARTRPDRGRRDR